MVNNGDTLIVFQPKIVRQIINDLERGDLCEIEKESYLTDIVNLNTAIEAKNGQISNLIDTKNNLNGIIDEKNKQLNKNDEYISHLKKKNRYNLIKGWLYGAGSGALITTLLIVI